MKSIKYIFWGVIILIFFAKVFVDEDPQLALPVITSEYKADVQLIEESIRNGDYDTAMPVITSLLVKLDIHQNNLRVWLFTQQAHIHNTRQHFHYAIESLKQANLWASDPHYYDAKIDTVQAIIDERQTERDGYDSYQNSRNSGLAKRLKNDVTIAYIYLDDNKWSKWSAKLRQKNHFNIDQVTRWYKTQANHYDVDNLNIDVRYFYVKSPKGLSKEWLREAAFFKHAQSLIAQQLGFANFKAFTDAIANHNPYHDVALVFHSNNQARSFAMSCANIKHNRCKNEYVMLTEKMNNNPYSWATQQVQSHEILHLFGAADLYNIKAAKNYAVTDLMNYYSQELKYASIEPITAWAIGWANLPKTPFNVEPTQD